MADSSNIDSVSAEAAVEEANIVKSIDKPQGKIRSLYGIKFSDVELEESKKAKVGDLATLRNEHPKIYQTILYSMANDIRSRMAKQQEHLKAVMREARRQA